MRSTTARMIFCCTTVAILLAVSFLVLKERRFLDRKNDVRHDPGFVTDSYPEQNSWNPKVDRSRPRGGSLHSHKEDRHEEEYLGRTKAKELLSRNLNLSELESELWTLKESLSFTAFGKLMVGISTSGNYTPSEKARLFNTLIPNPLHPEGEVKPGPPPYAVYNDVFIEWGNLPENRDQFLDFIDELKSPELQRILTCNYLQSYFSDLESFSALVREESDLSKPSYLGEKITNRLGNLDWLMKSMISSGKYSPVDIEAAVQKLEIDPAFKNGLIRELRE